MAKDCQVLCYYFPNYHPDDPRNTRQKGAGWSEWELVRAAKPRFPGHRQPKRPLWGYTNEADPDAMAQKIAAAADHAIDGFIFDWYYYDDGPFLNGALDRGFLGAPNNQRLSFALMWANHDWIDIHPYHKGSSRELLYPGRVTPETFAYISGHVIADYFSHPSYWCIDGCPYFSIYDLGKLLAIFGSVAETRRGLDQFRRRARDAGFPGVHLNAVVWGRPVLPGEQVPADPVRLVAELGFDSITSYVWIHHAKLPELESDYWTVQEKYIQYWDEKASCFSVPYLPNVTMGWDPSPRACQDDPYEPTGYPFTNTIVGNTPDRFREALCRTRDRLLRQPRALPVLNLNCWNEWTEGSYLEPDTVSGFAYLEAVRDVFAPVHD